MINKEFVNKNLNLIILSISIPLAQYLIYSRLNQLLFYSLFIYLYLQWYAIYKLDNYERINIINLFFMPLVIVMLLFDYYTLLNDISFPTVLFYSNLFYFLGSMILHRIKKMKNKQEKIALLYSFVLPSLMMYKFIFESSAVELEYRVTEMEMFSALFKSLIVFFIVYFIVKAVFSGKESSNQDNVPHGKLDGEADDLRSRINSQSAVIESLVDNKNNMDSLVVSEHEETNLVDSNQELSSYNSSENKECEKEEATSLGVVKNLIDIIVKLFLMIMAFYVTSFVSSDVGNGYIFISLFMIFGWIMAVVKDKYLNLTIAVFIFCVIVFFLPEALSVVWSTSSDNVCRALGGRGVTYFAGPCFSVGFLSLVMFPIHITVIGLLYIIRKLIIISE